MTLNRESIYSTPKPRGEHWNSVFHPELYLLEMLERMDAALRLARGNDNETVLAACRKLLELDEEDDSLDVFAFIHESFALDAYETCQRRGEQIDPVAYTLVLGTGGPHAELSDESGTLTLTISWGEKWEARSYSLADQQLFESFYETFYKYE